MVYVFSISSDITTTCLGELGPAKNELRDSLARISNKRNAIQVPHNQHCIYSLRKKYKVPELETGLLGYSHPLVATKKMAL